LSVLSRSWNSQFVGQNGFLAGYAFSRRATAAESKKKDEVTENVKECSLSII
jgi:hypothetical protein